MKVTVIVPVYNIEQYVQTCLYSLACQTYKELEILVVNDGSTDHSEEICQGIVANNYRMQLLNKSNGGLSSARNYGLRYTTGDCVMFVDGDDWIEADYVEKLVDGLQTNQSDIAVFQFKKERQSHYNSETTAVKMKSWKSLTNYQALQALFDGKSIGYSVCNKLFRVKLFLENNIEFPLGMLNEDKAIIYRLIDSATCGVAVSHVQKYHYYMRVNSIMKVKFSKQRFDTFQIHNEIIKYMRVWHPELVVSVQKKFVYLAIRMLMALIESQSKDWSNYQRCNTVIKCYGHLVIKDHQQYSWVYRFLVQGLLKLPKVPILLARSKFVSKKFRELELR